MEKILGSRAGIFSMWLPQKPGTTALEKLFIFLTDSEPCSGTGVRGKGNLSLSALASMLIAIVIFNAVASVVIFSQFLANFGFLIFASVHFLFLYIFLQGLFLDAIK